MKEILFILLEIAYKTVLFGIIVIILTGGIDIVSILMKITICGIALCLFFGNTFIVKIIKTMKKSPQ